MSKKISTATRKIFEKNDLPVNKYTRGNDQNETRKGYAIKHFFEI